MKHRIGAPRIYVALCVIYGIFVIIGWRIYDISWRRHSLYSQTALAQAEGVRNVFMRGSIYITDQERAQHLVATNRKFSIVTVFPSKVDRAAASQTADTLQRIAGIDREVSLKALNSDRSAVRVILRRPTDEQVRAVQELNIPGVSIGYETDRAYPAGILAADVVGFLGYGANGRQGQYGIESMYESELTGTRDTPEMVRWDIKGQLKKLFRISPSTPEYDATTAPQDIELTIDKNIQAYGEEVLTSVVERYKAASGVLIVQDPTTGRILAMADTPTFNPGMYSEASQASFLNGGILPFEPGSSFKPFTMAMGLDLRLISPDTMFNDIGDVVIDGYTIKNYNEGHFGRVSMTRVLEKSINTGVMYVQNLVGNQLFLDYTVNLGFGQRSGVELPGESSGDISNLYSGRRINFQTASFGQAITVTPLQLITAYSAIANGGKLMKPSIVAATIDSHGARTETVSEMIGTPFSAKTAQMLRGMLTSVVDNGFDKARIPRYDVAGKTGTAQIASPEGGYLEGQYNHSFVGFAPASNPKFVILIKMEKPQGITFAADSLSPAFKDMATFLLHYFNVPPTR